MVVLAPLTAAAAASSSNRPTTTGRTKVPTAVSTTTTRDDDDDDDDDANTTCKTSCSGRRTISKKAEASAPASTSASTATATAVSTAASVMVTTQHPHDGHVVAVATKTRPAVAETSHNDVPAAAALSLQQLLRYQRRSITAPRPTATTLHLTRLLDGTQQQRRKKAAASCSHHHHSMKDKRIKKTIITAGSNKPAARNNKTAALETAVVVSFHARSARPPPLFKAAAAARTDIFGTVPHGLMAGIVGTGVPPCSSSSSSSSSRSSNNNKKRSNGNDENGVANCRKKARNQHPSVGGVVEKQHASGTTQQQQQQQLSCSPESSPSSFSTAAAAVTEITAANKRERSATLQIMERSALLQQEAPPNHPSTKQPSSLLIVPNNTMMMLHRNRNNKHHASGSTKKRPRISQRQQASSLSLSHSSAAALSSSSSSSSSVVAAPSATSSSDGAFCETNNGQVVLPCPTTTNTTSTHNNGASQQQQNEDGTATATTITLPDDDHAQQQANQTPIVEPTTAETSSFVQQPALFSAMAAAPTTRMVNAASLAIPRPGTDATGTSAAGNNNNNSKKGNYVRLNLRNKSGSCRGARNVKAKSKAKLQWEQRKRDRELLYQAAHGGVDEKGMNRLFATTTSGGGAFATCAKGVDPVDDFVDGVFTTANPASTDTAAAAATTNDAAAAANKKKQNGRTLAIPVCSGHQQPCKLLTVKKTGPNKGRKFYACPCPRGEQCNHFAWADDTLQAAQEALLKNKSLSGFIARQVAAYMAQIKCLTVPELKDLAQRHKLDGTGKKAQLLMRLSVWVRDEVASGTADLGMADLDNDDDDDDEPNSSEPGSKESAKEALPSHEGDDDDSFSSSVDVDDDDADHSSSSSDEELELIGEMPCKLGLFRADTTIPSNNGEIGITASQVRPRRNQSPGLETARTAGSNCNEEASTEGDDSDNQEPGVPVQSVSEGVRLSKDPTIHSTLRKLFGHSTFRDGQEWAISRCLNKQRSLLVAPTGFGKSLCFTLPAAMMEGVCIVVSPLLSLIQDQIRVLPARLPAVTLSGPMSTASMAATLDDIIRGRIKVLFVSPERLTSASFRRLFRPRWNQETKAYERFFPEVSLFCVDEAHCLSQWAHNFRPSYLRLRSVIDMIEPKSVLAITATAGPRVVDDICRTLKIENGSRVSQRSGEQLKPNDGFGVRVSKTDRDNIDVRCLLLETQEQRLTKLLKILSKCKLTKDKTKSQDVDVDGCLATGSVIVYVWRQRDAEVVAENIQAGGISGGVVVYHGGMDSSSRMKAQSKFMRGKVRICVATIAFGLGINKADVAGVIHLYLSSSPEHYIQEIGRAGRDGRPAQAIALVLKDEVMIRHSLAHSDLISKSQVRALISFLHHQVEESLSSLPPDRSKVQPVSVSFPLAMSVIGCDCKAETAETILSLLEQRDEKEPLLFIEGTSYDSATIAPKRLSLEKLAEREPIAKAVLHCADCVEPPAGESIHTEHLFDSFESRQPKLVGHTFGSYSFSVAQCSNCLGESAEPRHVFAALRRLETNGEIDFALDTAPKDRVLSLRLTNEGMKYFEAGNHNAIDELVDETMERFVSTIAVCANKVIDINYITRAVSEAGRNEIDVADCEKSASLTLFQSLIGKYFEAEGEGKMLASDIAELPDFNSDFTTRELSVDAQTIISQLHEIQGGMQGTRLIRLGEPTANDYTALMITKFMHGLAPASVPLNLIRQHHLFGKMQRVQFRVLHEAVSRLFEPNSKAIQ